MLNSFTYKNIQYFSCKKLWRISFHKHSETVVDKYFHFSIFSRRKYWCCESFWLLVFDRYTHFQCQRFGKVIFTKYVSVCMWHKDCGQSISRSNAWNSIKNYILAVHETIWRWLLFWRKSVNRCRCYATFFTILISSFIFRTNARISIKLKIPLVLDMSWCCLNFTIDHWLSGKTVLYFSRFSKKLYLEN